MRIVVKAFGPEIVALIGREKTIQLGVGSSLGDLFRALEEEIRLKQGWVQSLLNSSFVVLVNGLHVKTSGSTMLKEGDTISILSPIGGGCEC